MSEPASILESVQSRTHIRAGHLPLTVANYFLVLLLGGPMGEELGWRGYALPPSQDRVGSRTASLGLGVVWGPTTLARYKNA